MVRGSPLTARVASIATSVSTTRATTAASASTETRSSATSATARPDFPATTASWCRRSRSCGWAWALWPSFSCVFSLFLVRPSFLSSLPPSGFLWLTFHFRSASVQFFRSLTLSSFFYFFYFFFRCLFSCPLGLILIGAECVPVGDCFWSNECLNGGTCVRSPETLEAVCQCPPFYEGLLCEIATDKSFTIVGGRDFIIIIIFGLMALLSKIFVRFGSFC